MKKIFTLTLFICIILNLAGCITTGEKINKKNTVSLPEQDIRISSPITSHAVSQKEFSIQFYKNSVKKSGYKCASAMPDGKTGYIIRCDFYSPDPPNIVEENYRQQNNFIKEINLPKCNKIIVSNNKDMAVYSKKSKYGSTLVITASKEKKGSDLVYTAFIPAETKQKEIEL